MQRLQRLARVLECACSLPLVTHAKTIVRRFLCFPRRRPLYSQCNSINGPGRQLSNQALRVPQAVPRHAGVASRRGATCPLCNRRRVALRDTQPMTDMQERPRILVIDDPTCNREILVQNLEDEYDLLVTSDGLAGVN